MESEISTRTCTLTSIVVVIIHTKFQRHWMFETEVRSVGNFCPHPPAWIGVWTTPTLTGLDKTLFKHNRKLNLGLIQQYPTRYLPNQTKRNSKIKRKIWSFCYEIAIKRKIWTFCCEITIRDVQRELNMCDKTVCKFMFTTETERYRSFVINFISTGSSMLKVFLLAGLANINDTLGNMLSEVELG